MLFAVSSLLPLQWVSIRTFWSRLSYLKSSALLASNSFLRFSPPVSVSSLKSFLGLCIVFTVSLSWHWRGGGSLLWVGKGNQLSFFLFVFLFWSKWDSCHKILSLFVISYTFKRFDNRPPLSWKYIVLVQVPLWLYVPSLSMSYTCFPTSWVLWTALQDEEQMGRATFDNLCLVALTTHSAWLNT